MTVYDDLVRQPVTYEHPLNERVRNLLRLELLFQQALHCQSGDTPWDSRLLVVTLIEILAVLNRSDLKTELIRELERQQIGLARRHRSGALDSSEFETYGERLKGLRTAIHATTGPLGQELREDEFLTSIRQRSTIPGGTCDFDLPAYHRWLNGSIEARRVDQRRWLESLALAREGVTLLLTLLRNSGHSTQEMGARGGYHRNLETNIPYQLIRISLEAKNPFFVEISGGKHRFTMRFMERARNGRPRQASKDIPFQLELCAL